MGKSRLVWEFTQSHRTQGWLVLESGSVSYGKATPYLPVIDLLKAYCRIEERDDQREIREKRDRQAPRRSTERWSRLLTPLLALLDVPVEDATWEALDPPQRRQRTLDAVKRLLLRESQVQPLLVVFEDLHWIDAETQALLDGLVESLPTARVLLLVNYRPEYQHGWGSKTYYLQLRIDPLPPESADELLDGLLGEDRTLEPLKRVLDRADRGQPVLPGGERPDARGDRGAGRERGAYRLAKVAGSVADPGDGPGDPRRAHRPAAPEDKRLLQAAAVIGKDVPFALLRAIADVPEESSAGRLDPPPGGRVPVRDERSSPDLEYTFKHALTHEVAYGSLLAGAAASAPRADRERDRAR